MSSKELYVNYCNKHAVALFFTPGWLQMLGGSWDVIYVDEGNASLFFVYHTEKKLQFKIIRNGFLTPYSGFLFPGGVPSVEIQQRLVSKALQRLPNFHELHIDLHPDLDKELTFDSFLTEEKITNILSITDMESVQNGYKPSLKRQIKKATQSLQIVEKDDIQLFFQLHQKTFQKQQLKTITPLAEFEKTWKYCNKQQCGKLMFAVDPNKNVHAALFLCYDDEVAYYLAGGTDAAFYGSGAMSYLMHTAIQVSSVLGKKRFDFEGSMIASVNTFFSNFRPTVCPYFTISKKDSMLLKMIKKLKN
nr:GNAT family N-acetyltransferase [Chitinophagaceae bacterium]